MYEKLKFPASSMTVTKEMIKVATFDLIPTEWLTDMIWSYFPEDESFSLSFATAGIEGKLFLKNAGLIFYMVILNAIYGLLHFILYPFRH